MRQKLIPILIWAVLALGAGAVGSKVCGLSFWSSTALAAAALTINGLIAEWDDRNLK